MCSRGSRSLCSVGEMVGANEGAYEVSLAGWCGMNISIQAAYLDELAPLHFFSREW